MPGYLTIAGAAEYTSVSTRTIKRWVRAGLPVHQGCHRGKVLIKPSDIDVYLQRKTAPKPDLDAIVDEVMRELVTKEPCSKGRPSPELSAA